jgi:adenylate cyclase
VPDDVEQLLRDLGATDDDLAANREDDDRVRLAGDLVLRGGQTLTVEQAAARAGVRSEVVRHIYGMLGVKLGDGPVLGDADVALVRMTTSSGGGAFTQATGDQLLRVVASSTSRMAEAGVAAYVQDVEAAMREADAPLFEQASANAKGSQLAVDLAAHLGTIFVHHMRAAVDRQRSSQVGIAERSHVRLGVGFIDMVGFTPLSRVLSITEFVTMINRFEETAFACASDHDGRIVKSIGDEVMFVAEDPRAVCAIALDLVARFEADERIDPRGGVCAGEVLFRLGDYYGPVVNLASRLADEAVPGEILTDESLTAVAGVVVEPGGRRKLKGFDAPVAVWSLASATP